MRLAFILGEIGSGLRRNLSMVVSVVLVTFISLTFVGAAALLQLQVSQMKGFWYDRMQVAVYLCGENYGSQTCAEGAVTDQQRQEIEAMLESPAVAPYVEDYQHETQRQALAHFKEQFEKAAALRDQAAGGIIQAHGRSETIGLNSNGTPFGALDTIEIDEAGSTIREADADGRQCHVDAWMRAT